MQLQTDYRTAAIFQPISQSPVQQIKATVSLKFHFQKTGQSHIEEKPWWVKWTMTTATNPSSSVQHRGSNRPDFQGVTWEQQQSNQSSAAHKDDPEGEIIQI